MQQDKRSSTSMEYVVYLRSTLFPGDKTVALFDPTLFIFPLGFDFVHFWSRLPMAKQTESRREECRAVGPHLSTIHSQARS